MSEPEEKVIHLDNITKISEDIEQNKQEVDVCKIEQINKMKLKDRIKVQFSSVQLLSRVRLFATP